MSLLTTRTQFVKVSGRYDLVDDGVNFSNKGADFYITSGQKFLDRLVNVPENTATIFLPLVTGEYSVQFQYSCRSIREVFINNTTDRYRLKKVSLRDLKEVYADTVAATGTGGPTHYAIADMRALLTAAKEDLGTFINLVHVAQDEIDEINDAKEPEEELDVFVPKYNWRGIIIVPPVDESYTVEVSGLFSQNVLSADGDENYWTQQAPDLLLKAALYQLEVFSRGTENAKNWMSAISAEVKELEKDFVDEEVADIDNMKG